MKEARQRRAEAARFRREYDTLVAESAKKAHVLNQRIAKLTQQVKASEAAANAASSELGTEHARARALHAVVTTKQAELVAARKDLSTVDSELARLRSEHADWVKEEQSLRSQIAILEKTIGEYQHQATSLNHRLAVLHEKEQKLAPERQQRQKDIEKLQKEVSGLQKEHDRLQVQDDAFKNATVTEALLRKRLHELKLEDADFRRQMHIKVSGLRAHLNRTYGTWVKVNDQLVVLDKTLTQRQQKLTVLEAKKKQMQTEFQQWVSVIFVLFVLV